MWPPVCILVGALLQTRQSLPTRVYAQAFLERYGVTGSGTLSDRAHREEAVRSTGFGGVRLLIGWDHVERVRGVQDWGRTDSIFDELRRDSLESFGLLAYSPSWAVPAAIARLPRSNSHRPSVGGSTARGDTLFAAFAAAAARRYQGRVSRWEIWNEENHPYFWFNVVADSNKGPSAADYASLFVLARDSILAANPHAQVAVGGLASFGGRMRMVPDPVRASARQPALPPHAFLRDMFMAGVHSDAVGIHPYSSLPPGTPYPGESTPIFPDQVIDSVAAVLDAFGRRSEPLWVTEWGVDANAKIDQTTLNAWFRDALTLMLCNRRIAFVTVHALTDPDPETHFGLLAGDGSPARDGLAFREFLNRWSGCSPR